jgi:hypothetical protein
MPVIDLVSDSLGPSWLPLTLNINSFTAEGKTMILNQVMAGGLHAIKSKLSAGTAEQLNVPANELGNRLIVLYYKTHCLATRKLITEFMSQAGVVWLRKLLTRDTGPISSSQTRFACMSDYLGMLAANDDAIEDFEVINR